MLSIPLKDNVRESSLIRGRVLWALVIVSVLVVVLLARSFDLQVLSYQHYTTRSRDNRVKVVPIAPVRGLIHDRRGVVLAQNLPTFSLEVVPELVKDMDEALGRLAGVVHLSDADRERIERVLGRSKRFASVELRGRLEQAEVARFAANRHRFPGFEVHARLTRDYPLGSLAAHAVGYVGRINQEELERNDEGHYRGMTHIGKTGIERQYEELLRGRAGVEQVEINAQGRVLRTLRRDAPRPGHSLYLNLDSALQSVAEAAFAGKAGALVAIEPDTGAVLALVSVPSFDPNLFVHGIDAKRYRELSRSSKRPLFNRALSGRYPPGSTVKPFMGFAGIEQRMDLANGHTWCRGYYQLKGYTRQYRDWKRTGHGKVGLADAIEQSCDVYFYELAHALGIDRIYDAMTQFGFGLATGIDVPGESSGLMPSRGWKRKARGQPWYPGETLITGIGQGFMLTTPLQLANATAILGVRGRRVRPRLLGNVVDPASGERRALPSVVLTPVIGRVAGAWDRVIDAMVKVVHGRFGTARRIGVDAPAKIAGKTGTAQVFSRKEGTDLPKEQQKEFLKDHALFVAFAPVRDPQIAVALVVEHGGSGSSAAAPIAREVLDAYLGAMPERRQDLFAKYPGDLHPAPPHRPPSRKSVVNNGA